MDTNELYIPVILGTGREGRLSDRPANWMVMKVKETGTESELIDVKDWIESPFTSNAKSSDKAKALSEKLGRADGVIIVAPEYNHGYPGELKLMLDMFFPEWGRIPCGICGVAYGKLGGARMVEQLKLVVSRLHMIPIWESMYFSKNPSMFDEEGILTDMQYDVRAKKFLDEMLWYAKHMKGAVVE